MNKLKQYKQSLLAGMSISVGAFAYLITLQKTNNPFISAMMFYTGLCIILSCQLHLFTGQVLSLKVDGYTEQSYRQSYISNKAYITTLVKTWIGNLIGSIITSILLLQVLHPNVEQIVTNKLSLNPIQMIIGGIFCNILVCLAVDNYKMYSNHIVSGFLILCFVLCGFNHIVADFSYYAIAIYNGMQLDISKIIISLVFVTIGNICGGLLVFNMKRH
jgi:nitrite transporter NirC